MQIESFQRNFQRHKRIRDSKDFLLSVSKFMLKKEPAPQVYDLIPLH